jgi:hypothetical protein
MAHSVECVLIANALFTFLYLSGGQVGMGRARDALSFYEHEHQHHQQQQQQLGLSVAGERAEVTAGSAPVEMSLELESLIPK